MTREAFDAFYMRMALREAEKAASDGEVPLGAVLVEPAVLEPAHDGHPPVFDWTPTAARILGRAHNQTEGLCDATAHAALLALSEATAADRRVGNEGRCGWQPHHYSKLLPELKKVGQGVGL